MTEAGQTPAVGTTSPGTPGTPIRPRPKAEPRRPLHLAVVVGLSAGTYAAALAGVTALQATSEQALTAYRTPTSDLILQLKAEHDRLEARIARAAATYNKAATAYGRVASGIGAFEQKLGDLARQVAMAENIAATSAGAGQSGGGGGGHNTSVQAAPGAPIPTVTRAAPAPPPPVQATTCASGKPCP